MGSSARARLVRAGSGRRVAGASVRAARKLGRRVLPVTAVEAAGPA